mgnify:FL=1
MNAKCILIKHKIYGMGDSQLFLIRSIHTPKPYTPTMKHDWGGYVPDVSFLNQR